jgi:hypothetical protein
MNVITSSAFQRIFRWSSFLTGHLFFQNGTVCTERQRAARIPFRPEAFLAAAASPEREAKEMVAILNPRCTPSRRACMRADGQYLLAASASPGQVDYNAAAAHYPTSVCSSLCRHGAVQHRDPPVSRQLSRVVRYKNFECKV